MKATCAACGRSHLRSESQIESEIDILGHSFCGVPCFAHWRRENDWASCDLCGKMALRSDEGYTRLPFGLEFCSARCREEYERRQPSLRRGRSERIRRHLAGGAKWERLRLKVLDRDGYQCQGCGSKSDLEIHHIIPINRFAGPDPNLVDNLVALCRDCHKDFWAFSVKGRIAAILLLEMDSKASVAIRAISRKLAMPSENVRYMLESMEKEGLIHYRGRRAVEITAKGKRIARLRIKLEETMRRVAEKYPSKTTPYPCAHLPPCPNSCFTRHQMGAMSDRQTPRRVTDGRKWVGSSTPSDRPPKLEDFY